uniref:alpha-L-fucosidase n=1 Tax=uncultured Draconibacterium sp. TaxID=1573823 RepID=UPI0032165C1C
MQTRRNFIKLSALTGTAALMAPGIFSCNTPKEHVPFWLTGDEEKYLMNPGGAALEWFQNARFGLFIHYGLYSLLGRREWVQFTEKIPVKEYEKLKDRFSAENFDADKITDMALDTGMKYINLVVKHHDSFCLWDTKYSDFKSTNSPAKRDFVDEFADQCRKKGLALFLTYSYGRDWRHPHAPNRENYKSFSTRPAYEPNEPSYKYGNEYDMDIYIDFAQKQIKELLSNYGDIAGISLGGSSTILSGDIEAFQLSRLYEMIQKKQSHILIANGPGVNGDEDYFSMLRKLRPGNDKSKLTEISDTLQPTSWGYNSNDDGKHKSKEDVIELLKMASETRSNLLLNTGPLPDGKIHPEDIRTLKEVGKYLEKSGFPQ